MYKKTQILSLPLLMLFFMTACSGFKNSLVQESKPKSPVQDELYSTIAYMDSIM